MNHLFKLSLYTLVCMSSLYGVHNQEIKDAVYKKYLNAFASASRQGAVKGFVNGFPTGAVLGFFAAAGLQTGRCVGNNGLTKNDIIPILSMGLVAGAAGGTVTGLWNAHTEAQKSVHDYAYEQLWNFTQKDILKEIKEQCRAKGYAEPKLNHRYLLDIYRSQGNDAACFAIKNPFTVALGLKHPVVLPMMVGAVVGAIVGKHARKDTPAFDKLYQWGPINFVKLIEPTLGGMVGLCGGALSYQLYTNPHETMELLNCLFKIYSLCNYESTKAESQTSSIQTRATTPAQTQVRPSATQQQVERPPQQAAMPSDVQEHHNKRTRVEDNDEPVKTKLRKF